MSEKTIPSIEELMNVEDDLSMLSRKALVKKNAEEGLGLDDNDIMKTWTPGEARAYMRQRRIELGVNGPTPEPEVVENGEPVAESWKLEIPVLSLHQLGRDCFVGTVKYADIDKIEVDADVQRPESKKRLPAIANYVLGADGYFGSVMLTINGDQPDKVVFLPYPNQSDEPASMVGTLIVEQGAHIVVNDGQHRIAGIKKAIADKPDEMAERMNDDIAVLIYVDLSKGEQRQLFADVNLNATKPPRAIGLAFNDRNVVVHLAKAVIDGCAAFRGRVNYVKQKVGKKDEALFTFSAIVDALSAQFDDLTPDLDRPAFDAHVAEAVAFWSQVDEAIGAQWEAKNYAINKNALVAVANLSGMNVDWTALAGLDWSLDGELARIASDAGGSNAATKALSDYIKGRVVVDM